MTKILTIVAPREEVAARAIDYLVQVLDDPDSVPIEEALNRVLAAVTLLNAYTALKALE